MNEKYPKVLVAAPTYEGKHYIFPRWYNNIKNLDYPNYDWLIVDNSRTLSYHTKLRRLGYQRIVHVNRGGNSRFGIGQASEYIRQYAIENNYDYIMFIETDLLPPRNIIQRLLGHEKMVVGAVYEIGLHGSKEAPRRPILYHPLSTPDGGSKLEMLTPEEGYKMLNKGVIKTPAIGLGCCLIHRDIFHKYPFKYSPDTSLHTDVIFYWDLWNAQEPVWVDTDIVIYHENQNWINVKDW